MDVLCSLVLEFVVVTTLVYAVNGRSCRAPACHLPPHHHPTPYAAASRVVPPYFGARCFCARAPTAPTFTTYTRPPYHGYHRYAYDAAYTASLPLTLSPSLLQRLPPRTA